MYNTSEHLMLLHAGKYDIMMLRAQVAGSSPKVAGSSPEKKKVYEQCTKKYIFSPFSLLVNLSIILKHGKRIID